MTAERNLKWAGGSEPLISGRIGPGKFWKCDFLRFSHQIFVAVLVNLQDLAKSGGGGGMAIPSMGHPHPSPSSAVPALSIRQYSVSKNLTICNARVTDEFHHRGIQGCSQVFH